MKQTKEYFFLALAAVGVLVLPLILQGFMLGSELPDGAALCSAVPTIGGGLGRLADLGYVAFFCAWLTCTPCWVRHLIETFPPLRAIKFPDGSAHADLDCDSAVGRLGRLVRHSAGATCVCAVTTWRS
jgi:hypothetical protein